MTSSSWPSRATEPSWEAVMALRVHEIQFLRLLLRTTRQGSGGEWSRG